MTADNIEEATKAPTAGDPAPAANNSIPSQAARPSAQERRARLEVNCRRNYIRRLMEIRFPSHRYSAGPRLRVVRTPRRVSRAMRGRPLETDEAQQTTAPDSGSPTTSHAAAGERVVGEDSVRADPGQDMLPPSRLRVGRRGVAFVTRRASTPLGSSRVSYRRIGPRVMRPYGERMLFSIADSRSIPARPRGRNRSVTLPEDREERERDSPRTTGPEE